MNSALSIVLASFGVVSVTNHAGGVLSGELTAVTNGTFTVGGRTLPLKALPAAEQRRLKVLAGQDVRTATERQRAKMLDYELRRIDVRLKAGEITEQEAETLRQDARGAHRDGRERSDDGRGAVETDVKGKRE